MKILLLESTEECPYNRDDWCMCKDAPKNWRWCSAGDADVFPDWCPLENGLPPEVVQAIAKKTGDAADTVLDYIRQLLDDCLCNLGYEKTPED